MTLFARVRSGSLLVAIVLIGCGETGPTGPAGPQGPEGPQGPQGPNAVPTTIEVSPTSLVFTDASTQQLTATVRAQDGSVIAGAAVTWTSSDGQVAALSPVSGSSVDPGSVHVTATGNGSATITASVGAASSDAAVTVDVRHYVLAGTPTPSTVFDDIEQTYRFANNLTNSIWQRQADIILSGDFASPGYWAFAPATAAYATTPDNGTDVHARMVQVPITNTVVFSRSAAANGVGVGDFDQIAVAAIDTITGLLTAGQTAVFSDGFTGSCQLLSSSATEVLCYDGTDVRRYSTTAGSATLTASGTLSLSDPLPAAAECNSGAGCYGGTFAFDGAYYYFAAHQSSSGNLDYLVYDLDGTLVSTFTAAGSGAINGTYFDWSVGRYSTHDGFGNREGPVVYETGSDTHNFSAIATTHVLW